MSEPEALSTGEHRSDDGTTPTPTPTPTRSNETTIVSDDQQQQQQPPELTARGIVGGGMDRFTALINDNMIAARYGVFATIALLTAYGISNTPLFFRYRSVAEIPKSLFVGRRRLYCRVIGVHRDASTTAYNNNNNIDGPIQITVRHLSPIGMLLPASWFESLMRINPTSGGSFARDGARRSGGGGSTGGNGGLLGLRVAGVCSPPVSRDSHDPLRFLEGLARNRAMVSCQLLGREIRKPLGESVPDRRGYAGDITSTVTGAGNHEEDSSVLEGQQVALCKIRYRPHFFQLFPTDVAEALVRGGTASAAPDLLCHSPPAGAERRENANNDIVMTRPAFQTEIVDASQRIQDIRNDVKYLDKLAELEFEAAQKSAGMWSVPEVRQLRKDLVDEVDFQAKASLFQKIWRRIRGG